MDGGVTKRLGIAGAVGASGLSLAVLAVAVGPAGARVPAPPLLPDLSVSQPRQILIERTNQRAKLRFSHTTANRGDGPLEISPDLTTTTCTEGGENGREAYQYVFRDRDGSGVFERSSDGPPEARHVGCMIFHEEHDHYHFKDFALYELYRERTGRLVGASGKVSFCVFDLSPLGSGLPGAERYYEFSNCDKHDGTHGISVGWTDTYGAATKGQELDVTGMRRGRYCLVSIADPEDRLKETTGRDANNIRRVRIAMRPGRAFVRKLDTPCRSATP
ncbi:MAG: lysyl oxidase family protein [Actinomycetota bacterium]|nr:lysyl oxidase family protein [Actinomycetota bacterium]